MMNRFLTTFKYRGNYMKILKLERHLYALELNKIHLETGQILPAPQVTTIQGAKTLIKELQKKEQTT